MAGSVIKSVAGPIAGGVVGGLFGREGDERAEAQAQAGADRAQQIINPLPFQGNSLFFNSNAAGQVRPNGLGRGMRDQFKRLNTQAFRRSSRFNRRKFADRMFQAGNRVNDKREGQAFSSLESKLFNRQGASTGTQRQIADFASDIEDRRSQRFMNAQQSAQQFGQSLLGEFGETSGMLGEFGDRFTEQQHQNLQGAQFLRPFAIDAPAQADAAGFRAQNTQDFFGNIGNIAGGAVNAGVSGFLNPGSGGGAQSSFARPSFGGEGFNPFGSLGF